MKKLVKAVLVGGAVAAAGIGFVSTAQADGSEGDYSATAFAAELKAAAPNDGEPDTTPAQARNVAAMVCAQRRGGFSEAEIVTQMTDPQSPHRYAVALVKGAEFHFCPELASR